MPTKHFLFILFIFFVSCDYQMSQKDKYPKMLSFSEVILNPEKSNLKYLSGKREDIEAIFISKKQCLTIGYVKDHDSQNSPDSIVISRYTSLTKFKRYYFKIKQSNDTIVNEFDSKNYIDLYKIEMIDDVIYTSKYKFSPPDYKPQLLDSLFWEKRVEKEKEDYNIVSIYNNDNVLKPFDSVVIGHSSQCGGGRLGGPIICSVYLDYYKIPLQKKTIYFKEISNYIDFKIINIFGENCLLYFGGDGPGGNKSLFLIDK